MLNLQYIDYILNQLNLIIYYYQSIYIYRERERDLAGIYGIKTSSSIMEPNLSLLEVVSAKIHFGRYFCHPQQFLSICFLEGGFAPLDDSQLHLFPKSAAMQVKFIRQILIRFVRNFRNEFNCGCKFQKLIQFSKKQVDFGATKTSI